MPQHLIEPLRIEARQQQQGLKRHGVVAVAQHQQVGLQFAVKTQANRAYTFRVLTGRDVLGQRCPLELFVVTFFPHHVNYALKQVVSRAPDFLIGVTAEPLLNLHQRQFTSQKVFVIPTNAAHS